MCITLLFSLLKSCIILESTTVLLLEIKSFSKYLTMFSRQVSIYLSNFNNKHCLPHCCFFLSDWLLCSYEKENLCHGWRIIWKTVWICGMLWPKDPAMDCYMSIKREKVKELARGLYKFPWTWLLLSFNQTFYLTWNLVFVKLNELNPFTEKGTPTYSPNT